MNKNKIIIILGQTSTGKSDFAVEVAKCVNSEIISADSRQVYKGMNLGTGKITKKEMDGIPHHLLDIVSPSRVLTVNDYKKLADKKIKEIIKRKKIPIICGGTGFYIDTVINNVTLPEVKPNKELRATLSKKSNIELMKILSKFDPIRANNIDKDNPVRIIRAIEIAKALGKVPDLKNTTNSAMAEFVVLHEKLNFNVLKIGLTLPPEILKERIKTRLLYRIKKGMIEEVENLHKSGISWKRLNNLGLEYRYVSMYLQEIENLPTLKLRQEKKNEMIEKLNTEIWHYAKRQKTWFKRDKSIIWIDPTKNSDKNKVLKDIKNFLKINP